MHGDKKLVQTMLKTSAQHPTNITTIYFPPAPYLHLFQQHAKDEGKTYSWGGQNISEFEKGANTGEISAPMLKEYGCQYVLIGHSERRHIYQEDNETIACKYAMAQKHDLTPILCIGETQHERETDQTLEVVRHQIDTVIQHNGIKSLENAILAYEPVWAIGTGLTATPQQAQEVHQAIRENLAEQNKEIAKKIQILYGGSVKPNNAEKLLTQPDIDGALIGGASLDPEQFTSIQKSAS